MSKLKPARIWCIIGVLSLVLLAQGVAWGTSITVGNANFSSPAVSAGGNSTDSAPPWNGQGAIWGVYNPSGTGAFATAVTVPGGTGAQVGFANDTGTGSLFQELTTGPNNTLAANTTYTLTVYVGWRQDTNNNNDPLDSISLDVYSGSGSVSSASSYVRLASIGEAGSFEPGSDNTTSTWTALTRAFFTEETLTFTTGASPTDLGDTLAIFLNTSATSGAQGDFADVGLTEVSTVSAVPLPAAAWLLGFGLLGLVALGRRKRTDFGA